MSVVLYHNPKCSTSRNALALLPGWEDSSGAHLEVHLAHRLGMKVRKIEEFIECSQ